ncbi:hypothetical protein LTR94_031985, partial [Friedmanniomyces endolithicus]
TESAPRSTPSILRATSTPSSMFKATCPSPAPAWPPPAPRSCTANPIAISQPSSHQRRTPRTALIPMSSRRSWPWARRSVRGAPSISPARPSMAMRRSGATSGSTAIAARPWTVSAPPLPPLSKDERSSNSCARLRWACRFGPPSSTRPLCRSTIPQISKRLERSP